MLCHVGDAMTLSLVRGTLGRGVWARDLAGSTCCVLVQNTLLSQSLPPHKRNNGYLGSLVKYLGGREGRSGVVTPLLASCSGKRNELQPGGTLGLCT